MCKIIQSIARIGCLFVVLLALQLPGTAQAHEGSARIELNTQQTSSGAEVEIRGVNIAAELPITLALLGAGYEYPLGTAVGDEHGDFVVGVRVPAEAPAGAYTVRAFGSNRVLVIAPLRLLGVAAEEEGAQRDQDEPLLAPMPQPRAAPANPVAAPEPTLPVPTAQQPSRVVNWMLFAIAGLAAALVVVLAIRRRAGARSNAVPLHGDTPAQS